MVFVRDFVGGDEDLYALCGRHYRANAVAVGFAETAVSIAIERTDRRYRVWRTPYAQASTATAYTILLTQK